MFGLMRARSCGRSPESRHERQRIYCGTCKTLGRLYGQPSRLLLNHDAVFLGELLTALAPPDAWAPAFTPRRCAALPAAGDVPPALAYAATAHVALAAFKVEDRVQDVSRLFATVRLALSRPIRAARRRLDAWQFPWESLWSQLARQAEAERAPVGRSLADFAEPTAAATRLVFGHGAQVVGRPNAASALEALGDAFGRIVYTVDALQDREADRRAGSFNAVEAAGVDVEAARAYVRECQRAASDALDALTIAPETRAALAGRFRASVAAALGGALPMSGPPSRELRTPVRRKRRETGCCCGSADCWVPCDCAWCTCEAASCCDAGCCCDACGSSCGDACCCGCGS